MARCRDDEAELISRVRVTAKATASRALTTTTRALHEFQMSARVVGAHLTFPFPAHTHTHTRPEYKYRSHERKYICVRSQERNDEIFISPDWPKSASTEHSSSCARAPAHRNAQLCLAGWLAGVRCCAQVDFSSIGHTRESHTHTHTKISFARIARASARRPQRASMLTTHRRAR